MFSHLSRMWLWPVENRRYGFSGLQTDQTDAQASAGTVKRFNSREGSGFINRHSGAADLFARPSDTKTTGYASVDEEQEVEFETVGGKKGPCPTKTVPSRRINKGEEPSRKI